MLQLDLWDKQLKQRWNFLNVYDAAQSENKNEFLAELARFCSKNNQPYLVGGDFNIIRFASDKNKPSGVHKHTDLFNNIISTYDLIDIHLVGGRYTWSNNHETQLLKGWIEFSYPNSGRTYFPVLLSTNFLGKSLIIIL